MWIAMIIQAVQDTYKIINQMHNNAEQQKEIARQAQAQSDERMRNAKKQMQEQKTSFLKGGVGFDSGSANSIINETYTTARKDVKDMEKDSKIKQRGLRFGNFMSILSGTADTAKSAYDTYSANKMQNPNEKTTTVGTKENTKTNKNKASGWSDSGSFGKNADKVV